MTCATCGGPIDNKLDMRGRPVLGYWRHLGPVESPHEAKR